MSCKILVLFAISSLTLEHSASAQLPLEEFVVTLAGFSVQSGVKVGELHREPEVSELDSNETSTFKAPTSLFQSLTSGNLSEFSICVRFRAHYQRPEMVLMAAYVENKTNIVIGLEETRKEIYFKYSVSEYSNEMVRISFDWLPRLNEWEHICFSKKKEPDQELRQIKFFVNGKPKGQKSGITARLDDITLVTLGQTDPPSAVTGFSGDIAHFVIVDRGLNLKDIKALSDCETNYLDLLSQGAPSLLWREGTWESIFEPDNETSVDVHARPLGQYLDWREICRPSSTAKTVHMVPIYRRKSKDFHKQICTSIGGSLPDLVNFGKEKSDQRNNFLFDLFLNARIPRVTRIPLRKDYVDENVESFMKTPLNMQNCFVDDELVIWLDDSDSATKSPLARGSKGVHGVPINPKTGKPLNFLPPGLNIAFGPNLGGGGAGDKKEECVHHILSNGTAVEKCGNDPQACSICLLPRRTTLRIRGLCEKSLLNDHRSDGDGDYGSEFDSDFFVIGHRITGETIFRGKFGSHIRKDVSDEDTSEDRGGDWILESLVGSDREESRAVLKKTPPTKLPVGRNSWEMVSDICKGEDNGGDGSIQLSLTSCKKDEFTCNTGKCIPLNYRCDLYEDCENEEDEENCDFLEINDNYKGQVAPRHIQKGVPWPVYVEVEVVSFPEIQALEQKISVDFHLSLRWYDPRLEYRNLKPGKQENPISSESIVSLWVPRLGLLNGLSEFQTIVIEDDAPLYRGYVWRRSNSKPNGIDNPVEDEIFAGSKNPIILKREFYQDFKCDFDLSWYPFDRQKCFMNFTVQGATTRNLILRADNKNVNYLGLEYLVEYQVGEMNLDVPTVASGNFSTAVVEIMFVRRVFYHLLNIFLQSLLLIITGYMSLFFHVNNFSDRVMVALTVMLVMASLQSAIQDSLPRTAYIKFIDWWILFSLNTQIFIMAYHTFLGYYCYKEYREYKEDFRLTRGKGGITNNGFQMSDMKTNGSNVTIGSDSSLDDELVASEEYDYPKAKKNNKYVMIIFCSVLIGFNVIYWTVAMVVYLG
ncbi:hypothetical protein TCAL_08599 [Tigriopus californicus]|uniref:Neurotransmitter-gated ion-channel ligand-binding domain-containing protein n=1 Tax=Tigriopus californicus TaxID=6832 RepID=A0A553P3N3_TIGCA|nr:uncharacterized protein LOC131884023 [Tigriopus californicus]TRY72284.1 hypothetical protein TCAL_08599 [Tigriopus californicus]|eukprot:TCALIF_08599-PA protein Name:"Similar to Rdl Gamma-aminobutyric acid receptor subunit beta (Drosophila melanogaster)" AED:0.02 eAED:0.02 QI:325/1/1/1/0.91/0.92/13/49/1040